MEKTAKAHSIEVGKKYVIFTNVNDGEMSVPKSSKGTPKPRPISKKHINATLIEKTEIRIGSAGGGGDGEVSYELKFEYEHNGKKKEVVQYKSWDYDFEEVDGMVGGRKTRKTRYMHRRKSHRRRR
jgi:hypothetical protein